MIGRARFLVARGYTTLSIDFQAHGESPGERITMGHLEALDAAAGVAYLRDRYPGTPIAVVGRSLGGAAALLAKYAEPPEAMVLEAVYADLETAIDNRLEMRFGSPGRLLTPFLTFQFELFTGIEPADLNPLGAIGHWNSPVLLVYGSQDRRATLSEGRALFEAARGHKLFWTIEGAAHVDFHRYAQVEYEDRVAHFLARNLQRARFITQQPVGADLSSE